MRQPPWDVLDTEGVRDVADQAARRVHARYSRYVELDDLKQDALIRVVTKGDLLEAIEEGELGLLQFRLERDLVDALDTTVSRQRKQFSFDRATEAVDDGVVFGGTFIPEPALAEDYNRESVEMLLPAVWDEQFAYGAPTPDNLPDPDMPKGSTNKSKGGNLPASIADIKTGWAKAPLTRKERRSLLMHYGLGCTHEEIAQHEAVDRTTITHRLHAGVGKIVARLNSGIWYELEAAA